MQDEATSAWRLELGDNDDTEAREQRKIVVLALLDRLTNQIEALYEDAIDDDGRYVADERDERVVQARATLRILRAEAAILLS